MSMLINSFAIFTTLLDIDKLLSYTVEAIVMDILWPTLGQPATAAAGHRFHLSHSYSKTHHHDRTAKLSAIPWVHSCFLLTN